MTRRQRRQRRQRRRPLSINVTLPPITPAQADLVCDFLDRLAFAICETYQAELERVTQHERLWAADLEDVRNLTDHDATSEDRPKSADSGSDQDSRF